MSVSLYYAKNKNNEIFNCYISENPSLPTPQTGQVKSSGSSSHFVPGCIPLSESPAVSSYIYPHTHSYFIKLPPYCLILTNRKDEMYKSAICAKAYIHFLITIKFASSIILMYNRLVVYINFINGTGATIMPFIHIYAYSGRDTETKKKAAEAIVQAASAAMGAPETAFTVVYEDIERDNWEKDVAQSIIEPLREKMLVDHGKPVND